MTENKNDRKGNEGKRKRKKRETDTCTYSLLDHALTFFSLLYILLLLFCQASPFLPPSLPPFLPPSLTQP
jgi:hypothetical protein